MAVTIRMRCPGCGREFSVTTEERQPRLRCLGCGTEFVLRVQPMVAAPAQAPPTYREERPAPPPPAAPAARVEAGTPRPAASRRRRNAWIMGGAAVVALVLVFAVVILATRGGGGARVSPEEDDRPAAVQATIAEARRLRASGQVKEARDLLRVRLALIGALGREDSRAALQDELAVVENLGNQGRSAGSGENR